MGCPIRCPIRLLIGVMVCYTAFVNYTIIGNISLSVAAMVQTSAETKASNCVPQKNGTAPEPPDYGKRFSWDAKIQGRIIGSFFWGFTAVSLPAGMVAEWVGPYKTIIGTNVIMLICNALCVPAAHAHYALLILCRVLIGASAGLVYPALQCLIARWAPPQEKGKFVAALLGNNLGTCIMWYSLGAITARWGWNWGFYSISMFMGTFCAIFAFVASDGPDTHRWISQDELNYILESQGGTVSKKKSVPPYKAILTSGPFWILAILHFGNLWGLYLQMTGVPKFLTEGIGFDIKDSGAVSAIPQLVRVFMGFGFGIIGDLLRKRGVPLKLIRKGGVVFSHLIPGVVLGFIPVAKCDKVAVAVLLTMSQAINGAAAITNLAGPQDLAPNYAGTLFGILTLIGGTTGFITPEITAALTKDSVGTDRYGIAFIIGGIMYAGCGVVYIIFGRPELQPWNEKKQDQEA